MKQPSESDLFSPLSDASERARSLSGGSGVDTYDVSSMSDAPADAVWSALLDSARWPEWSVIDSLDLDRSEQLDPRGRDGLGAVRAFRTAGLVTRERITALQYARSFRYEIISSHFFSAYVGLIELVEQPDRGTHIRWRGRYRARRGRRYLMRHTLPPTQQKMVDGLAAFAARHPPDAATAR